MKPLKCHPNSVFSSIPPHVNGTGPKAGEGKSALSEGKSSGGAKTGAGEGKFGGK